MLWICFLFSNFSSDFQTNCWFALDISRCDGFLNIMNITLHEIRTNYLSLEPPIYKLKCGKKKTIKFQEQKAPSNKESCPQYSQEFNSQFNTGVKSRKSIKELHITENMISNEVVNHKNDDM